MTATATTPVASDGPTKPIHPMQPTNPPEGWEYVSELHGCHDKQWFLWFHQNKNKLVWDKATTGREWKVVRADEIGMQWFDEDGGVIPQSDYWAQDVFVLIRKIA